MPNVRPNRIWRHLPQARNLGRSDYSGLEPLLDSLDEIYSSWMRDIRLGKFRRIVPASYLETGGRGQGAAFDMDEELFVPINAMLAPSENALTENQFAIRVQEHTDSADHFTEKIVIGVGYSTQSLGLQGEGGLITATEVDARIDRSTSTRGRKITYWRPALGNTIFALLAIDRNRFGSNVIPQIVDIDWPAAINEDPLTIAQTTTMLRAARLISQRTVIGRVNRDWSEEEIAEIASEPTPDPPPAPVSAAPQDPAPGPTDQDALTNWV